ncbi:hypothetical protein LEN26_008034 [Aphanomyces euteiches]|nr:hypothetical protein AeMF1_019290 [Aphanomyces euteiches]KAH9112260.1 hypothetical protein AeMF1_013337 [Aphanomyces euteiches]KAH9121624.1 hypothetical protein AeMF1_006740 [Aphanomyces euteiches]KAH9122157.1 hypothetical protein AeMF1_006443 [Aphanomyces euteiches]KAH9123536.1 hypothetical protein AeMF1_005489 [Aphanomyces euteiches]
MMHVSVTVKETKAMQKQFTAWLEQDGKDTLEVSISTILSNQPEVASNALFALAARREMGHTVSFPEYLQLLTWCVVRFRVDNGTSAVIFRLYDTDRDGFVSPADGTHVITSCFTDNVDTNEIEQSIRHAMKASQHGLTKDEFDKLMTDSEVFGAMSI